MKAIINRGEKFGLLDGVIVKNDAIMKRVMQYLRAGRAKLLVDSETTLMYELTPLETMNNLTQKTHGISFSKAEHDEVCISTGTYGCPDYISKSYGNHGACTRALLSVGFQGTEVYPGLTFNFGGKQFRVSYF